MSSPNLKAFLAETPVPSLPTKHVSWGIEQLCLLNSRFNEKADKGEIRKESENVESLLRNCLTRLNEGLAETKTCGQLADTLAEFWVSFVFVIHPFSDGNERTAKFFCIKSLNKFSLSLLNPWLFDEFEFTRKPENDVPQLSKLVLENLKIFDPSLE